MNGNPLHLPSAGTSSTRSRQRQEQSAGTSSAIGLLIVRQVPPAESAAKQRQCDRRHRSKERDERATRSSVTGGWPGREYDPSLKDSWAVHQRFFLRSAVELTAQTPTIESAAKESASAEKSPIGGRSVARAAIAREPEGVWTTGGRREGDADYRSGKRELHCGFYLILRK